MKLNIDNYIITPGKFVAGTRGSYGIEPVELVLSSEWDGLSVMISFYPPQGTAVSVMYTGEPFYIPAEVMNVCGNCRYVVSGYRGERKLISVEGLLHVLNTASPAEDPALEPTPTLFEQIMSAVVDKADSDHVHDERYAPQEGSAPRLTSGLSDGLVSEEFSEYEGIISGHSVADGNTERPLRAGVLKHVDGMSIRQQLDCGRFVDTQGWTACNGELSAQSGVATLQILPQRMRQFSTSEYTAAAGEKVYIDVDSDYDVRVNDYSAVELGFDDNVDRWYFIGLKNASVQFEVYDPQGDDMQVLRTLTAVIDGDEQKNRTGIYCKLPTQVGGRYYIRADVDCDFGGVALSLDDGTRYDAAISGEAGARTISGIVDVRDGGEAELGIWDRRAPAFVVSYDGDYYDKVELMDIDKFLSSAAVHNRGTHSYRFEYYAGDWYLCGEDGNRLYSVYLDDYGIDCSVEDDTDRFLDGDVVTVELSYPFEINAEAELSYTGNTGLSNVSIDAAAFAGALGTALASGTYTLKYENSGWMLGERKTEPARVGISGTAVGNPSVGACINVKLTVASESMQISSVQVCELKEMGLENMSVQQLDRIFGSKYHARGISSLKLGGVCCVDSDGNIIDGGLYFDENYELFRLPDGTADRLDIESGTLIRRVGIKFISGTKGEYIPFEDASTDSAVMSDGGRPGVMTEDGLLLDREMPGERVFYALSQSQMMPVKCHNIYRAAEGAAEFLVSRNEYGDYTPSAVGGVGKVCYMADVARMAELDRVRVRALFCALGLETSQDTKVLELAQKIKAALA